MDKRTFIQKLFGYCPCCNKWLRQVTTERRATQYLDYEQNWLTGCKKCQDRDDEYWSYMWEQYHGSI